jgi:26S proteasome regulatory subunit N9
LLPIERRNGIFSSSPLLVYLFETTTNTKKSMNSYVDATSGSIDHCNAMAEQFPDLAEKYYKSMADCCQQKLWHQLTLCLLDFYNATDTNRPLSGDDKSTFLALYTKLVQAVSKKLNPLSLSQIAAAVGFSGISVEGSKSLLNDLLEAQKDEPASCLYLQSKVGLLSLSNSPSEEDLAFIYSTIKTNAPMLDQLTQDTPEGMVVNNSHYEMSMTYFKIVGPPEAFYEEAIRYLNYFTPTESDKAKSHALAVDLCLAALTGEGVYNLGQVVNNPILLALKETPDAWLVELLEACGKGQVQEFKKLVSQTYPTQIASQPALVNMSQQMQEKMTLLALVGMVFERPASERTLSFTAIAERLEISVDQVEWVIMRAFSVKLMEGSMDQVDGTAHITWILPRVLQKEQMADLATRFGEWAVKVSKTKDYMVEEGGALTQ